MPLVALKVSYPCSALENANAGIIPIPFGIELAEDREFDELIGCFSLILFLRLQATS